MSNATETENYCKHLKIELDHAHMVMRGLIASNENRDKIAKGYRECCIALIGLCAILLTKLWFFP